MLTPSSSAAATATQPAEALSFVSVQAVRAYPLDAQPAIPIEQDHPPAAGWVDVKLPDVWSTRWPDFDGVVWYRLSWQQARVDTPVAVLLDYLNMSGAIYLNGTLLDSDAHLSEPLSRAWNMPRYLLLPSALLHEGTNTMFVRVSGFAIYQCGLGSAAIGPPALLQARSNDARWIRIDLQLFSLAVTATLGCFFLSMWLMRRRETVYSWFSLMSLTWWIFGCNQTATSPWPFASTDGWEIANVVAFSVYCTSYTVFTLRFCARRWPRFERVLWLIVILSSAIQLCVPHQRIHDVRTVLYIGQAIHFFATSLVFIFFAWRQGRTEHRILACCTAVFMVAGVHDLLTFLTIIGGFVFYTALTSQLQMIGMALVLGRHFVANLRRIEGFNEDLTQSVEAARSELTRTLQRQHELEIANARLGERLNLAHDLHDGLGGTLVSNIVALERAPQDVPPQRFLSILKELRDDLRLIIDSTASQHYGETTLADQLAPLRHRLTRLLETQGIECHWYPSGIEACVLPSAKSMEIMRIVQEALTNVFKHSRASQVEIGMRYDEQGLRVTVQDNGVGFIPHGDGEDHGTGMRSMRARVGKLGGIFDIQSSPGATLLMVQLPPFAEQT
ncbi:sensor histidine kinase [Cupriavidus sp. YAF13]|uniref:sensor histidine kinase n=1 Tax=Cupriavidus sp. YAF13 TaxID=3233075 RepID=UPI003F8F1FF7